MFKLLKQVIFDCCTSANGDYDPARVIGYFLVVVGALEFLILFAYFAIKKDAFDASGFALGLASIGGTLGAAAAGVMIKNGTEIQPSATPAVPGVVAPALSAKHEAIS